MAIVNGAKVLMWENEIESIEPGKKADYSKCDDILVSSVTRAIWN